MPGFPPNQFPANGSQNAQLPQGSNQMAQNGMAISQPPNFTPQPSSGNFPQFNPVNHAGRMGAPMMEGNDPMLGGNFGQTVETPSQYQSTPTQQVSPVQTIPGSMDKPRSKLRATPPTINPSWIPMIPRCSTLTFLDSISAITTVPLSLVCLDICPLVLLVRLTSI